MWGYRYSISKYRAACHVLLTGVCQSGYGVAPFRALRLFVKRFATGTCTLQRLECLPPQSHLYIALPHFDIRFGALFRTADADVLLIVVYSALVLVQMEKTFGAAEPINRHFGRRIGVWCREHRCELRHRSVVVAVVIGAHSEKRFCTRREGVTAVEVGKEQ